MRALSLLYGASVVTIALGVDRLAGEGWALITLGLGALCAIPMMLALAAWKAIDAAGDDDKERP